MKTLGIDLSSQSPNTAACIIEWHEKGARIVHFESSCSDATLDTLVRVEGVAAIGIDAPLGWPKAFRTAVKDWTSTRWDKELGDELTYRLTDKRVIEITGVRPLRVAADRIAFPAMRAMALLRRHEVTDRSGPKDGRFFEVYPAASLKVWNLHPRRREDDVRPRASLSYKKNTQDALEHRRWILAGLKQRYNLTGSEPSLASDHLLDSLIAALTARSAKKGNTHQPKDGERETAKIEGWIHIPAVEV